MKTSFTEAEIQAHIIAHAATVAGTTLVPTDAGAYMRASHGRRHGPVPPAGWPDLTGYHPHTGKIITIEVKRPGMRPTAEQAAWLELIGRVGHAAWFDGSADATEWLLDLVR